MSKAALSQEEVLQRFAGIVAKSLRVDPSAVSLDAYLDDLGAESLDLAEISLDTEDEFMISIPETSIFDLGREVFGPGVLEQDGTLTEEGKKFLRSRLQELDGSALQGEVKLETVPHWLSRVGNWVRMIQGLKAHSLTNCTQCGSELRHALAGKMKCGTCGTEVDIPSGDEINRQWVRHYYESAYLGSRTSTST